MKIEKKYERKAHSRFTKRTNLANASSIQRTDELRFIVAFSGIASANRCMTVLFLSISHSHSPPFLHPFVHPVSVSRWRERDCCRGGLEDEVRAAPRRRINRDRETRPLSHPPRSSSLLSSPSSVGRSTLQREPYLRLLCRASTSPRSPPLASPRHSRLTKWKNRDSEIYQQWENIKYNLISNIIYYIIDFKFWLIYVSHNAIVYKQEDSWKIVTR